MKKAFISTISILLFVWLPAFATGRAEEPQNRDTSAIRKYIDSILKEEMDEQLANMPNVEVGKGISFSPKNNSFKTTIRFRMQNMAEMAFNDNMGITEADGQVKRLRLRFDGYIFSPKFIYTIQLGFTGSDAKDTPNGKSNLVMDAIAYYKPNSSWSIGFGQTKIKSNRALLNSSGSLQFVDRSIVNSEFGGDRDFGFFGEYHHGSLQGFALSALASITMGEGRNWGATDNSGLNYTGRLEFFPMGKFHAKGEYIEGDTYYEPKPKLMVGLGYSFNNKAMLTRSVKGSLIPDDERRDIHSYYADIIFKYKGFACNADYMGRHTGEPTFSDGKIIYNGSGVNVQASYLFNGKWELAVRNSSMLPESDIRYLAGYKFWNQSTICCTRYIIGHSLKLQLDLSYNHMTDPVSDTFSRYCLRFQLELGL